jgi:lipopolysaccharide-binding protein
LNGFNVHVNGGPSWLYNFLISIFEGNIRNAVVQALENGIKTGIDNGLNHLLQTLPVSVAISSTTEIDYALIAGFDITSSYITLPQMGEFYQIGHHKECPAPRSQLPDSIDSNMLQLIISDFTANSAGFVYWGLGQLTLTITNANLPSWAPIRLNTTDFRYLLPNLYKAFPGAAMVVKLSAAQSPQAIFTEKGANVSVYGYIAVSAVVNDTLHSAFTLNGTVSGSGIASLKGQSIIPSLTSASVDFSLFSSEIGNFDVTVLNALVNKLCQGLLPVINSMLAKGFPLPMVQGITFVQPSVHWGNHYMAITTDVIYT